MTVTAPEPTEQALADLLFDPAARAGRRTGWAPPGLDAGRAEALAALDAAELEEVAGAIRTMVRERSQRGVGRLGDAFPLCFAAWRRDHPDDVEFDQLMAAFLASPAARTWCEGPGAEPGACVEEAFAAFAAAAGLADAAAREDELYSAVLRALVISPTPSFLPPAHVRRAPGGWFAIACPGLSPVLHAAVNGRYLRGPITQLAADLLAGEAVALVAQRHGIDSASACAVRDELVRLRLAAA